MGVNFIDSEYVELDGKSMIYFRQPLLVLKSIEDTLKEVGAEAFFKSTDKKVKTVRESMAALFFLLAIQKETKKDWFLMQPKDDPPDFILMNVKDDPINISLDQFELVEIPTRCQTFEEMMSILQNKFNKQYPKTYSLLIFINHERSKEWVNWLNTELQDYGPFQMIWTVHLLWHKGQKEVWGPVVNKIRPAPVWHIEAMLSDCRFSYSDNLPTFMEEIKSDGKKFVSFKSNVVKELIIKLKKLKYEKK